LDAVDVYDGLDAKAPLIGRYCGQQRNVVIFSTEHHLLVTFTTLKRTADSQNRGFLAKFEFSETFVKLGQTIFSFRPSSFFPLLLEFFFLFSHL
jgi:hypothetical protein